MQAIDLQPFIENATTEVLEAMCFISSDGEVGDDTAQRGPDWVSGELDFLGDPSGRFGIAVPPATASTIAANFLGEDEAALTETDTNEVVCELTNMICGTFLGQVNSRNIYTLSPPRASTQVDSAAQSKRNRWTYSVDEGFIHVWVELRHYA